MTLKGGKTTLHKTCASLFSRQQFVRVLLREGGANPDIQDDLGWTPLHFARRHVLVLEHGADPILQTNAGCNALHYAASSNAHSALRLLLEYGGDSNRQNEHGSPLLHRAIVCPWDHSLDWIGVILPSDSDNRKKSTIVEVLLDFGADLIARDLSGGVALEMACQTGNTGCIFYNARLEMGQSVSSEAERRSTVGVSAITLLFRVETDGKNIVLLCRKKNMRQTG